MAQSTVRLIVDAQNAIQALQRTNNATKALSNSTDKLKGRIDRSNNSLRNKGRAAKSAAGGVRTLTGAIGPLLKALAAIAAARFVFVQSAELETQRKSLEVLTGSLTKTNQIIKELQDFGAVTPFTSSELIEQTKRLKAFGFETNELVDTTKRLSDVAGATGADLQGIATAFGQIRAKGKLQQEENLQLLERGVDITTELKRITGLQGEEFASAMRKGQIGADLVNQALINVTNEGGAFFGGATAQAETLAGKLSTLVDSVQNLARTIGEVLGPTIKTVLGIATRGVQAIDSIFQRINNIKDIGFGNVLGAENEGRTQAERLTKNKFGEDVKFEGLGANKEANKFFKEQLKLITQANIEREKLRQIEFQANEEKATAQTKEAQKAKEVKKTLEDQVTVKKELTKATDGIKEKFEEIGDSIGSGISDALVGAIEGTKSLGEAAKSILNDISSQLLRLGINTLLKNTGIGIFSNLQGFAKGGRPPVGRPSVVGVLGPELFVPDMAGTIIPNNRLGSSTTNVVINVDASGSSVQGNEQSGNEFGEQIAAAVQAVIINEKRVGGLLN